MNSQQLLFINLIIIVIAALFFKLRRRKRQLPVIPPANEPVPAEIITAEVTPKITRIPREPGREQTFFVYNGHEWEAFEVLGLPSGVSLEIATRHYQELIRTSDPSTFEFYDAAYTCILKLRRP